MLACEALRIIAQGHGLRAVLVEIVQQLSQVRRHLALERRGRHGLKGGIYAHPLPVGSDLSWE